MSQWKINKNVFECDFEDVDFLEKYEDAFEKMSKEEKALLKTGKASEITRSYCQLFFNLFDNLFGEGSSEKIFEGKCNGRLCDEVYEEFLNFVGINNVAIIKTRNDRYSKNRQQRRAAQKNNAKHIN